MKALIKNYTIMLPKKVIKSAHVPENGECEVTTAKNTIKLSKYKEAKNRIPVPHDIIDDIKSSNVICSIEKMASNEIVEDY